ncbi:glucose/galactose MFS transporter [Aristophania vespae]|uniref:Glucose/galactose MFS transporter n=1 Tax=Aristophania vespae TaxID=2697033 RepID=A0A6P1NFN1_9PROT|nr:glucose/galactose MFS transporter [Aristophania vespae]QHI96093.1 glucose/galactose MFS transporter [Aristophania vespae]UMM63862.1 L-fucose-proton symporter [Aristophania vespae]
MRDSHDLSERVAGRLVGPYSYSILVISACIFVAIGFVTWINGPLISFVEVAFSLDEVSAFLIPLVFYISYFFFSIPAAFVAKKLGMKLGLSCSLLVSALGVACFGQFVVWKNYPGVLAGLLILGAGVSLMQLIMSALVSLLGPASRAAQRIAIMGICNKAAGIVAPIIIGVFVMGNIGSVAERAQAAPDKAAKDAILYPLAHSLYGPYLILAAILVLIGIVVLFFPLPTLEAPPIVKLKKSERSHFLQPHVIFGFIALFLYAGNEVLAASAIGTYGSGFGLPLDSTKFFTTFTLTAMLIGYIAGFVVVPRFVTQEVYVQFSCFIGIVFAICAFFTHGYSSVFFIALLGAANAMIMPILFPIALRGAGALTSLVSAVLVMTYCGGAIIPPIYVLLKPYLGFQGALILLVVPSYLAMSAYAYYFGRVGLQAEEG